VRRILGFSSLLLILLFTNALFAQSPVITGISPTSVVAGTQVTITGTNFGTDPGWVEYPNVYSTNTSSWTNTQIVTTVPATAQSGPVYIETSGLATSNTVTLTVVYPNITGFSPNPAVAGQQVTISGTNFGVTNAFVEYPDFYVVNNANWTDNAILTTVPGSAQSGPVYIQTSGGGQSNSVTLNVVYPAITSISPNPVVAGQQVTITGTNFGTNNGSADGYVMFGDIPYYSPSSWIDTQIVTTVPATAQSGPVYVANYGGGQSNSVSLTVEYPNITGISPNPAVAGAQVTITGTNFGTNNGWVEYANVYSVNISSWTDTQIVTTVPATAQSGPVYIQTSSGGKAIR